MTKNSDDYDKKYMKIKFDLDDALPPNKTIEIHILAIVFRAIFYGNNKYYPQVLLDKYCVKTESKNKLKEIDINPIPDGIFHARWFQGEGGGKKYHLGNF